MKSFIFVSFAFLAFAFYEMSGGADFQPPVAPTPPAAETQTATAPAPIAKTQPVKAATLVASPAITPVDDILPPAVVAAVNDAMNDTVNDPALQVAADLEQIGTSFGQGLTLFPDSDPIAQPLMLASLEQGVAGLRDAPITQGEPEIPQVAEPVTPPADIREVRGTRVNMRDGPGTIYPVIMRLTLGKEVEVLGESGTGWLRLRVLPERTTGWVAASLISKAGR